MESKLVISCRKVHNLIKIHHTVKSYYQFHCLTKVDEQIDGWTHTALCAHLRLVQYGLNTCFAVDVKEHQDRLPTMYWLSNLHKRPY